MQKSTLVEMCNGAELRNPTAQFFEALSVQFFCLPEWLQQLANFFASF
jgi:hypothetical protein